MGKEAGLGEGKPEEDDDMGKEARLGEAKLGLEIGRK